MTDTLRLPRVLFTSFWSVPHSHLHGRPTLVHYDKEIEERRRASEKFLRNLFKRLKSANDSASQSNLTRVSVSSALAFTILFQEVQSRRLQLQVSNILAPILVLSTTIWSFSRCQCYIESGCVLS